MYKCCVVVSPRVAKSKFSLVYLLLITMYRHRTTVDDLREKEREKEKRKRERENCEAVFSSLSAFVLRGQENSAGKIIFLPHSSSLLRRCVQQPGWRRLCCSSVIRFHRFPSLPLPALCLFLFAIDSRIYSTVPYLLRFIIKFPLLANIIRFVLRYLYWLLVALAFRSIIRVRSYPSSHPSHLDSHLRMQPLSCFYSSRLFIFCSYSFVFTLGSSPTARFMKVGDMG